jgi:demethylmenaquinone methyltransferase/2-methoxy-6-polyprenyl-1,4-benzoquinol methylase
MYYANKLSNPSNVPYDKETIPVFARWFGSWRISLQRRALRSPQLTRFYDQAAPEWSQKLDRLGFPGAYETLLRRVLRDEAPGVTGAQLRVLDCGVGPGALSCALARVLPAPFKLDAIDISPRMLERGSSSLRDTDVEVSLCHGEVRKLPYGNGVFDLVMTAHVLEHLVDPSVALSEMVRVLKPGGLLIACLTRRSALGMYGQLKWRTHRVTPAEAEGWLLESGLDNAHCRSFDHRAFCQQLSVACVGRKPLREIHTRSRATTAGK